MSEDELEEIRKKKLDQLKDDKQNQEEIEKRKRQQEAQKKKLLRQVLTNKARQRLSNLRMAKPDFVEKIEQQLIMLAQRGDVQGKINDQKLKQILKKAQENKKDINIKRR